MSGVPDVTGAGCTKTRVAAKVYAPTSDGRGGQHSRVCWRHIGGAVAVLALSACSLTPRVPYKTDDFSTLQPGCTQDALPRLCQARWRLDRMRDEYAEALAAVQRERVWVYDVPLIGLAIGAAAAGIYGAHRDTLAGIGLGAASFGGFRSYANPDAQRQAYVAGLSALDCIGDSMHVFYQARNDRAMLKAIPDDLMKQRAADEKLLASLGAADADARDALNAALDAATTAVTVANTALTRIDSAPQDIVETISAVDRAWYLKVTGAQGNVTDITAKIDSFAKEVIEKRAAAKDVETKSGVASARATAAEPAVAARAAAAAPRAPAPPPTDAEKAIARAKAIARDTALISATAPKYVEAHQKLLLCPVKAQ
jgi:hypothetical protein